MDLEPLAALGRALYGLEQATALHGQGQELHGILGHIQAAHQSWSLERVRQEK